MGKNLPKYITKTKYGYHVRVYINGEYHAEHFSIKEHGKDEALKKAKKKQKEFVALREKNPVTPNNEYDTRFLYENPDNSTGIIGVFYKEEEGKAGEIYPYFCTTVVKEKGKPKSYGRSIKRWGKGEALLQICCLRKRKMLEIYGERFDAKRFDKSVISYMKENYLSYRKNALERLSNCTGKE